MTALSPPQDFFSASKASNPTLTRRHTVPEWFTSCQEHQDDVRHRVLPVAHTPTDASSLNIGLDIDGVLYPFAEVFTAWAEYRLKLPTGSLPLPRSWHFYADQWGLRTEDFLDLYRQGVEAGVVFSIGRPLPGALAAVRALADAGHRIHYVSARAIPGVGHGLARERTEQWLTTWGFPMTGSLTIADDKSSVPTDVFLDDAPHNHDELLSAGHPCPVIWAQPWNEEHPGRRVTSWDEFLTLVRSGGATP